MERLPADRRLEYLSACTGDAQADAQLLERMLLNIRRAEILGTPAGRRALGLASPEWWDAYYAGMREAPHRTKWLRKIDGLIKNRNGKKMLLLAPRNHGKTEAVASIIARAVCYNRDICVMLICANEAQAILRLGRVKAILKSAQVVEDFTQDAADGFWGWGERNDDRWREASVQVTRTTHKVDPTIIAIGAGGKNVTGAHPNLIIADDIEGQESTLTAREREKTKAWFKGTLLPTLMPGGTMVVIGTKKHHDDLYTMLEANPVFELERKPAILKWPKSYELQRTKDEQGRERVTGVETSGEEQVLWSERDFEWLLLEREAMRDEGGGAREWAREFQHEVQDDSSAAVPIEQLQHAQKLGKKFSLYEVPQGLVLAEVHQGWDFSLVESAAHAARKDTDYTVGLTWARTTDDHRILLGIVRKRGITQDQLMTMMEEEYERIQALGLRVINVAMERNNFGRLHVARALQRGRLPVVPHDTSARSKADPWVGIPGLAMLFEQERVILPSRTRADRKAILILQQELHGLGVERHDDTVMALHVVESVTRMQPNQAPPLPKQGGLLRNPDDEDQRQRRGPGRRSRLKRRGPPAGATRFNSRTGWE